MPQFLKMHGAGNDFVIFEQPVTLSPAQVQAIAARDNPVTKGCDQVIVMEPSQKADSFMRIYNADGGEVDACGNATRCVAWFIMRKNGASSATVETNAGLLRCTQTAADLISADMGMPKLDWRDIPLSQEMDTLHVQLEIDGLSDPVCVSMGNPHVVFFVADAKSLDKIETIGAALQNHALFPKKVNVSIALITGQGANMRVWERGVGLTASCGTAACATVVAAVRRGLLNADTYHTLTLKNGAEAQQLKVNWRADKHVLLEGPVALEFSGVIDD